MSKNGRRARSDQQITPASRADQGPAESPWEGLVVPKSIRSLSPEKRAKVDALRAAALRHQEAGQRRDDAVARCRTAGLSWELIGQLVGTTGSAARQKYGQ